MKLFFFAANEKFAHNDSFFGWRMDFVFCRKDTLIFVCYAGKMHEIGRKHTKFIILATVFVLSEYFCIVKFLYTHCKDSLHFS